MRRPKQGRLLSGKSVMLKAAGNTEVMAFSDSVWAVYKETRRSRT